MLEEWVEVVVRQLEPSVSVFTDRAAFLFLDIPYISVYFGMMQAVHKLLSVT